MPRNTLFSISFGPLIFSFGGSHVKIYEMGPTEENWERVYERRIKSKICFDDVLFPSFMLY